LGASDAFTAASAVPLAAGIPLKMQQDRISFSRRNFLLSPKATRLGPVDINGGKLLKPRKMVLVFAAFATVEVLPKSEIPRLQEGIGKYT
jgi:hypothetical protein